MKKNSGHYSLVVSKDTRKLRIDINQAMFLSFCDNFPIKTTSWFDLYQE